MNAEVTKLYQRPLLFSYRWKDQGEPLQVTKSTLEVTKWTLTTIISVTRRQQFAYTAKAGNNIVTFVIYQFQVSGAEIASAGDKTDAQGYKMNDGDHY